jgi:hypothetical protein
LNMKADSLKDLLPDYTTDACAAWSAKQTDGSETA